MARRHRPTIPAACRRWHRHHREAAPAGLRELFGTEEARKELLAAQNAVNGARQWRARKGGYLRWPLEAHNYTRRKSTDGITASTASFLFVFAGFLPQRARGRHIGLQSLAKKGAGMIGSLRKVGSLLVL